MNTIVWAVIGGLAGLVAGAMMGSKGSVNRIENVLVGIFGAFIGGEFLPAMFTETLPVAAGTPVVAPALTTPAVICAFAGALVMLFLLRILRSGVARGAPKPRRKRG